MSSSAMSVRIVVTSDVASEGLHAACDEGPHVS
jgi:hypothetical protein